MGYDTFELKLVSFTSNVSGHRMTFIQLGNKLLMLTVENWKLTQWAHVVNIGASFTEVG